ncbi:secreted protein [Purpureocillium lavendulum]|uniref:Secreted protein n=1 Tax=Purpureocillium lavendulum TaxID=1247861 RepID=A0AB34G147_9HYPO|nr:secreted protein [Purpureocillium lavendulum]
MRTFATLLPRASILPQAVATAAPRRSLATTARLRVENKQDKEKRPDETGKEPGTIADPLHDAIAGDGSGAKGRTGGGDPLSSSSPNAPSRPKVFNSSVAGGEGLADELTKEQKEEVRQHNEHFQNKHDRGMRAPDDKVDQKFWNGNGSGNGKGGSKAKH